MPRVIHFEIHADEPERAVNFYNSVFGWQAVKWDGPMEYWLLTTGKDEPGIDGAVIRRERSIKGGGDVTAFICTIGVRSIDEYIAKVRDSGGVIADPKGPIIGVGWFAQCLDTEGNIFGLLQKDPMAGR